MPQIGGTAFDDGIESDIETNEGLEVDDSGVDPYADWNPEDGNPPVDEDEAADEDDESQVADEVADTNDSDDSNDESDEGVSEFPAGWEWAQGVNPEHARKSFERFTQTMQELSDEKRELEPVRQLAEELQTNPELQAYIRSYFAGEPMAPPVKDPAVAAIEERQRVIETQLEVEREFNGLKQLVAAEGYPPVNEDEVMRYAIEHGIPSMEQSYYAMNFRTARDAGREGAFKEVKRGKRAALPKVGGKGDSPKTKTTTTADIADMSEEEFLSGYGSLVEKMVG